MTKIYVFSGNDLDAALRAYVEESVAHYPNSAALIHVVEGAVRDLFESEYTAKFVSNPQEGDNQANRQIAIPSLPGGMLLTHPTKLGHVNKGFMPMVGHIAETG